MDVKSQSEFDICGHETCSLHQDSTKYGFEFCHNPENSILRFDQRQFWVSLGVPDNMSVVYHFSGLYFCWMAHSGGVWDDSINK